MRRWQIADRWLVHAYYTVSPYAPDSSGRILAAGADLDTNRGEVLVLSADGDVLDRFGDGPAELPFYHTGRWQTWSPDARHVYFTAGSLHDPMIVRRELETGEQVVVPGSRLLFHVGNHLAPHSRGEERILYVMTAAPDLTDLQVAVDLSYGLPGVHWSWQPDGEHLIGYGPLPDDPSRMGLAEGARDGTGYRVIAAHDAGLWEIPVPSGPPGKGPAHG